MIVMVTGECTEAATAVATELSLADDFTIHLVAKVNSILFIYLLTNAHQN